MPSTTYERVTERILELLEKGVCPWRQPWSTKSIEPQNFASGRHYSGMNFLLLSCAGFESPYFMTFRQVSERGGTIKKGSHGFPVVYWGSIEADGKTADGAASQAKDAKHETIPFLRSYTVFNSAQIEGIEFPAPQKAPPTPFNPLQRAEEIIRGWEDGPRVIHGMARAYYDVVEDEICLPSPSTFNRPESYYCTRFHEMGHATGAPSRLNRKIQNTYGDSSYAREELVAEMTSAFLCAKCGIDNAVIENQAAYLEGWMRALKKDSKLIVTAAGQGQRAANCILGVTYEPTVEKTVNANEVATPAPAPEPEPVEIEP